MASRVFVLGACLMAWLDSGSMAIRSVEDADEQDGAHLMPEVGHQEDEQMEAVHTLGLNRTKDCFDYNECIAESIKLAVDACGSDEACKEKAEAECRSNEACTKPCEAKAFGGCAEVTSDSELLTGMCAYALALKPLDWSTVAETLVQDKCLTCPAEELRKMCMKKHEEELEEMCASFKSKAADTQVKLKVATLNCLEIRLSKSTPGGFATINRKWVDYKDADKKDSENDTTWLTQQLNQFWDDGFALVSLQEVDQPSDLKESKFQLQGQASYEQLWHDKDQTKETAYLAWHPDILERTTLAAHNYPGTGLMFFEFEVKANGKKILVMAGHADSTPNQLTNITAYSPDIVLIDANQNGAAALTAYGDNYAVYPWDESTMTSQKNVYFYRKLAQALENTDFFKYLPENKTTCAKLVCSEDNTENCCGVGGKYAKTTETTHNFNSTDFMPVRQPSIRPTPPEYFTSTDFDSSKVFEKTCQYASRVCGDYGGKNTAEMLKLLQQQDDAINEENVAEATKSFDLATLAGLIRYDAPEPSWNKISKAQEDLIIYKKETVGCVSGEVYPSFTSGEYAEAGKTEGFPNMVWPSDHLLVTAEVTV